LISAKSVVASKNQLHATPLTPLPVTVIESIFANPPLVVATKLISFTPAFSVAVTLPEFTHVVHDPV